MDKWFYLERGIRRGPLDADALLTVLLTASDPRNVKVWREGLADGWHEAGGLPELIGKLPPEVPSIPSHDTGMPSVTFTHAYAVARLYRRLVALVGVTLIYTVMNMFGAFPTDSPMLVEGLLWTLVIVMIATVVTSYRLDRRLGSRAMFRPFGIWIPIVNLVVLKRIDAEAQSWCKRYGIEVGLLGPTKASLDRLRQADFSSSAT